MNAVKSPPRKQPKRSDTQPKRSDSPKAQNSVENRDIGLVVVGRFADGQNTEENTEDLSRQQRHFILEKLVGQNDMEAALAAGYALSTARNTKQKIWARPGVRAEFERLKSLIFEGFL